MHGVVYISKNSILIKFYVLWNNLFERMRP